MKKIIQATELQVGDFVHELTTWQTPRRFRVTKAEVVNNLLGSSMVVCGNPSIVPTISYLPTAEFILVHRLRPEGKTDADMLTDIDAAVADYWLGRLSPAAGRTVLLHLLEAYELGKDKPVELAPKPSAGPASEDHYDSEGHNRCLGAED